MTGIWACWAIAGSASASSWLGQATRTMSQPVAVSSAICWSVALMSVVGVVHIDCTETGASPPTSTLPTLILRGWRGAGRGRAGAGGAYRGRRVMRHQYAYGRAVSPAVGQSLTGLTMSA